MKHKIPIEDIYKMQQMRVKINRTPITDIQFTYKGKDLDIPEKRLEDWLDTGLNNTDFVLTATIYSALSGNTEENITVANGILEQIGHKFPGLRNSLWLD